MVIKDPYDNPPEDQGDDNRRVDWWNRPKQGLDYAQYKIGDTVIMVGLRPNMYGTTTDFYNQIGGFINVSDRFVRHRADKVNVFYPWNEGGIPTYETIFAVLKTLHYWIDELKIPKVYIHCDGGTHRAVTMFGFYLLSYHSQDCEAINNSYELKGREYWSNPLEYGRGYFKDIPAIEEFLKALKESKDDVQYGDSFEDFLNRIGKDTFKHYHRERFMLRDLPFVWSMFLLDSKFFVRRLTIGQVKKVSRWAHKKLNTKKGKELKRLGF